VNKVKTLILSISPPLIQCVAVLVVYFGRVLEREGIICLSCCFCLSLLATLYNKFLNSL